MGRLDGEECLTAVVLLVALLLGPTRNWSVDRSDCALGVRRVATRIARRTAEMPSSRRFQSEVGRKEHCRSSPRDSHRAHCYHSPPRWKVERKRTET
jgi:hypothetical protein